MLVRKCISFRCLISAGIFSHGKSWCNIFPALHEKSVIDITDFKYMGKMMKVEMHFCTK